jgi:hypothetical protein
LYSDIVIPNFFLLSRRKSVGAVAPFGSEPSTASSSLAQDDLPPAASSAQPTDVVAAATSSPVVAIRLPIKCGKGRAAAGGQSFGGSDTDSDTQSTKSTGSAHRVAARTFKKSFKGKAVAIVKPFSSVSGEKRSPGSGPVKEQKSGSKSDLLNLLYDFKSDEESSAGASSQLLSGSDVSGVTGTVTTAKSPNCDESDDDTVVELVTPPSLTGVGSSALVRAEISSAAAAATTAKQIRGGSNSNTGGVAAKPSVVARRLKFGGAPPELKAVRVRVEKLQQASAPPLYAAAAPAANQLNPTSVSGKYSAGKPEDGGGGEETIKKEPAAASSHIGSQPASVAEIKSEPVVDDSVGSAASDCSTEEKKVGEVKVEVEPTAAIPPDIKPGKVFHLTL